MKETLYDVSVLPERLKAARLRTGLSQYDFAQVAGIREKSYWQYEKGKALPPLDKLALLMNAHRLDLGALLEVSV